MTTQKTLLGLLLGLSVLATVTFAKPQWPGYYATYPSTYWQPTFSDLSSYTTAMPYYGSNYGSNIRIWPYVMGQYYYPYYGQYFNRYYGAYDTNSWNWYNSLYSRNGYNKK